MIVNKSLFLFSPADDPDSLSEELDIVKNMNLAIKEERYGDAGTFWKKMFSHYNCISFYCLNIYIFHFSFGHMVMLLF